MITSGEDNLIRGRQAGDPGTRPWVIVASGLDAPIRRRFAAAGAVVGGAALAVPALRDRLTNSFGASDIGSRARSDALAQVGPLMRDQWLFGQGFGSPKILDPIEIALTNFAANSPLFATYRGGIFVGVVFIGLMLRAAWLSVGALRCSRMEPVALGAGALGLLVVAFQLDITIVILTPATAAFSLLLVLLTRHRQIVPAPRRKVALT